MQEHEEATHLMVAKKQRAQEMPGTDILKYASLSDPPFFNSALLLKAPTTSQ